MRTLGFMMGTSFDPFPIQKMELKTVSLSSNGYFVSIENIHFSRQIIQGLSLPHAAGRQLDPSHYIIHRETRHRGKALHPSRGLA